MMKIPDEFMQVDPKPAEEVFLPPTNHAFKVNYFDLKTNIKSLFCTHPKMYRNLLFYSKKYEEKRLEFRIVQKFSVLPNLPAFRFLK